MNRKLKYLLAAMVVASSGCAGSDIVDIEPDLPVQTSTVISGGIDSLDIGGTMSLRAVAKYNDGSEKDVTSSASWTSSNPSVATVTGGLVTALSPGSAGITAEYGGKSAIVSIGVKPKPVVLQSVAIVGDSTKEHVGEYQYTCVKIMSDGTRPPATCVWSFPGPDYVTGEVNSTGLVTLWALGTLRVTASHLGFQGTLAIRVTGTPWSKLPPISAEAKALIPMYGFVGSGIVFQWKTPITVWADPKIPVQNLQDAFAFWREDSGGLVQFATVVDSLEAKVKVTFDPTIVESVCAYGGPSGITIRPTENFGCASALILAHEFGHVLGFSHLTSGTDIMGYPIPAWKSDPVRKEALIWTYTVRQGTIPVEG